MTALTLDIALHYTLHFLSSPPKEIGKEIKLVFKYQTVICTQNKFHSIILMLKRKIVLPYILYFLACLESGYGACRCSGFKRRTGIDSDFFFLKGGIAFVIYLASSLRLLLMVKLVFKHPTMNHVVKNTYQVLFHYLLCSGKILYH